MHRGEEAQEGPGGPDGGGRAGVHDGIQGSEQEPGDLREGDEGLGGVEEELGQWEPGTDVIGLEGVVEGRGGERHVPQQPPDGMRAQRAAGDVGGNGLGNTERRGLGWGLVQAPRLVAINRPPSTHRQPLSVTGQTAMNGASTASVSGVRLSSVTYKRTEQRSLPFPTALCRQQRSVSTALRARPNHCTPTL